MVSGAAMPTLRQALQWCGLEQHHNTFTARGIETVEDARASNCFWLQPAHAAKVSLLLPASASGPR